MIRSSLTPRAVQIGLAFLLSSTVACAPKEEAKGPERCEAKPVTVAATPEATKESNTPAANATPSEEGGSGFGSSGPERLGGGGRHVEAHVRVGKVATEGVYDAKIAARILRQNYARFRSCFEKDRFEEPLKLTFTLNAKGEVESPKGEGNGAKSELLACIEKASLGIAFPPPAKGTVTVHAPLLLIGDFGPKPSEPVARFTAELPAPSAATYDAKNDRYLVSNIDEAKNAGSIVVVDPDGKKASTTFLADGATSKSGVKIALHSPTALLALGDLLYVADETFLKTFDLTTGEPKGSRPIDPENGLSRLFALADGRIIAVAFGGRLSNSEQDEYLYTIDKSGKSQLLAKGTFGGVSGAALVDRKLWLTNARGEIFTLSPKNEPIWVMKPSSGTLTGIVALPGGILFLESAEEGGHASFGPLEGPYRHILDGIPDASGVAWDGKRKRLVVVSYGTPGVIAYAVDTAPAK